MKLTARILGVVLVAVVAVIGVAAAVPLAGVAAADATTPVADERPLNGTNSPWIADDERLDRFQERFDLTDEQVAEIQAAVVDLIDDDADRTAIRATVMEMLTDFGVADPQLGPMAERAPGAGSFGPHAPGAGPYRTGPADGTGFHHGGGYGPAGSHGYASGPYGPADGSCMD